MTPLAAYLAKQTIARPKHRVGAWREDASVKRLRGHLEEIHCFEITACLPLIAETFSSVVSKGHAMRNLFETYGFLPAPKTWLEWKHGPSIRLGLHLHHRSQDGEGSVHVTMFDHLCATNIGWVDPATGLYSQSPEDAQSYWPASLIKLFGDPRSATGAIVGTAHMALLLINSPHIIGRRQHMPNAGLERNLTRGFGVGKFPLHAWTEIMLEVAKPPEIDDGEPHEAHLTGRRALHFCRKHIRIRNGQLEYVRAHWRGDPALGIKRSRYTVVPAPTGADNG